MGRFFLVAMDAGTSMAGWQRQGKIAQELNYYSQLSEAVGPVRFLSYGHSMNEELALMRHHMPEASIAWLPPAWMHFKYGDALTGFVAPINGSKFRGCFLVRASGFMGGFVGGVIASRLKVPFVLRVEEPLQAKPHPQSKLAKITQKMPGSKLPRSLVTSSFKRTTATADAIIVPNQEMAVYMQETYAVASEKIYVIPLVHGEPDHQGVDQEAEVMANLIGE